MYAPYMYLLDLSFLGLIIKMHLKILIFVCFYFIYLWTLLLEFISIIFTARMKLNRYF